MRQYSGIVKNKFLMQVNYDSLYWFIKQMVENSVKKWRENGEIIIRYL